MKKLVVGSINSFTLARIYNPTQRPALRTSPRTEALVMPLGSLRLRRSSPKTFLGASDFDVRAPKRFWEPPTSTFEPQNVSGSLRLRRSSPKTFLAASDFDVRSPKRFWQPPTSTFDHRAASGRRGFPPETFNKINFVIWK